MSLIWAREREINGRPPTPQSGCPQTYWMSFLSAAELQDCPIEGCRGRAATRAALRAHLFYRNVRDTVVIMEEGNLTLPQ